MANSDEPILLVGVDTQTLIWALDEIESDDPAKEQRALWLMGYLTRIKAQVVISTVVLSELLIQIDPAKHADFIAALDRRFHIIPFDVAGARGTGAYYLVNKDVKMDGSVGARKIYKADLMIVSQAAAAGASIFFSDDAGCRKMATRLGMQAQPLPTQPPTIGPQMEMFKSPEDQVKEQASKPKLKLKR